MNALDYHERTKHYFNRFARSAGVLDWATQPDPFRRFTGAPVVVLPREPVAVDVPYSALFDGSAPVLPITLHTLSEFLRCAMGLSAWKRYDKTRWPLRVNPSSGNLHPTETYVVWGGRVLHYAVREHALEERCLLGAGTPAALLPPGQGDQFLVGLTSIHWREAWKYGERAFRYCQHDVGHAMAALRLSAARLGWHLQVLTSYPDRGIASVLGLDRDQDFADAERESPECLALVRPQRGARTDAPVITAGASLVDAARDGVWTGVANRLSRGHLEWPVIEQVASATRREESGHVGSNSISTPGAWRRRVAQSFLAGESQSARTIVLQRRSAVAFNPRSSLPQEPFKRMLASLSPGAPPWDATDWPVRVHLVLFIHRVDGVTPGLYAFTRASAVREEWRTQMRADFLWESQPAFAGDGIDLSLLLPLDMTWPAMRVSCDQDIAGDGYFSLAMLARTGDIPAAGGWLYRQLFWEAGMIGQMLYLQAEASGTRGTGIGCFYDDAVHEIVGLPHPAASSTWQSLYHFSVGDPIDDTRLTTEPGYDWEHRDAHHEPLDS